MKVAFYTFGCKLNQYETESLAGSFQTEGFDLVSAAAVADLFIINTCTVTSKSEQKARKLIRALSGHYPEALIIITGCYAQVEQELFKELGTPHGALGQSDRDDPPTWPNIVIVPQVDKPLLHDFAGTLHDPLVAEAFKQHKKDVFLRFYQTAGTKNSLPATSPETKPVVFPDTEQTEKPKYNTPFDYQVEDYLFHSRAFLKIQDGCDFRCTYCRVPLARGPAISQEPEIIIRQIKDLEVKGYREVVLTGVNITAYQYGEYNFVRLLKAILALNTKLRIRLSSLEPDKLKAELCEVLTAPAICPHFHIPVQSGSDLVLTAMKRRYRRQELEEALTNLQANKPGAFFAADIIVGFPGETDGDFLQTYQLVEQFRFSYLHVFPFSPRPGTPAYQFTPRVHSETVRQRVTQLLDLSAKLFKNYLASWQGKEVAAVLETKQRASSDLPGETWEGLADNYLKLIISGIPASAAGSGQAVACLLAPAQELLAPYPASFCRSL